MIAIDPSSGAIPRRAFVTLVLDCRHAPAHGGDSILAADGRLLGTVTSAAWGHRVGKSIAMGFVAPEAATPGTRLLVEVIGAPVPAEVVPD
jgi:dimethylglycine dehydrogenase